MNQAGLEPTAARAPSRVMVEEHVQTAQDCVSVKPAGEVKTVNSAPRRVMVEDRVTKQVCACVNQGGKEPTAKRAPGRVMVEVHVQTVQDFVSVKLDGGETTVRRAPRRVLTAALAEVTVRVRAPHKRYAMEKARAIQMACARAKTDGRAWTAAFRLQDSHAPVTACARL